MRVALLKSRELVKKEKILNTEKKVKEQSELEVMETKNAQSFSRKNEQVNNIKKDLE